ncbi:MAG TPA: tetratricopeptide repeat protein [Bryobacteraceae bacterium]|nr:tetratricopeptide repeat protein [Bryobacteraceae bacterium]
MKAITLFWLVAAVSFGQPVRSSNGWLTDLQHGQELERRGQLAEAEPLVSRLVTEASEESCRDCDLGEALALLATVYQDQARYTEAEAVFRRAAELREKTQPNTRHEAIALSNLANCYVFEEKYSAALPLFTRAAEILKQPSFDNPPELSIVLFSAAQVYQETNKDGQAENLYRESIQSAERIKPQDTHAIANAFSKFAEFLYAKNRLPEAEDAYKHALQLLQTGGAESADVAVLLNNLGEVYRRQGRSNEAEASYLKSLKFAEANPKFNPREAATAEFNLARLYAQTGRFSEANKYFVAAEEHFRSIFGPTHPTFATVIYVEGDYYLRRGFYSKALPLLSKAVEIFGQTQPNSLSLATAQIAMAEADLAAGNITEADQLCRSGLLIRTRILGSEDSKTLIAEHVMGEVLRAQAQYGEAEPLYLHAIQGFARNPADQAHLQIALNHYAALLRSMGRNGDAKRVETRVKTVSQTAFVER